MKKTIRVLSVLFVILLAACAKSAGNDLSAESDITPSQSTESIQADSFQTALPELIPSEPVLTPEPTEIPGLVSFRNGSAHESSAVVVLQIEPDEFEKLDAFYQLKELDLSGSACYDEIMAYINAHPEVKVRYLVDLDGTRIPNDAKEATVASLSDPSLLAYLPALSDLVITDPLTPEEVNTLQNVGIRIHYSVRFAGLTVSGDATTLDLSNCSPSDMDELKSGIGVLPALQRVNLKSAHGDSSWTLEQAADLQRAKNDLLVDYTVSAFGKTFSLADETVNLSGVSMKKRVNELRNLLPLLSGIKEIYLDNCGLSNEDLAALREEFPSPKIVWKVKIGGYVCHTNDVMIKFSAAGSKTLSDKDVKALKYCNEIRYMDLGHNHLHRMDFVAYMPDLEVCIMYNPITNIQGIENCKKLEYFECFSSMLKDVSPLAACTELKHLNICFNPITDLSPLYGLTKLERLWISRLNVPKSQIEHLKELLPYCDINTTTHNPTGGGWREHPRYDLLYEQFQYSDTHLRTYNASDLARMTFKTVTPSPVPTPEPTPFPEVSESQTP